MLSPFKALSDRFREGGRLALRRMCGAGKEYRPSRQQCHSETSDKKEDKRPAVLCPERLRGRGGEAQCGWAAGRFLDLATHDTKPNTASLKVLEPAGPAGVEAAVSCDEFEFEGGVLAGTQAFKAHLREEHPWVLDARKRRPKSTTQREAEPRSEALAAALPN
jgi:hypothetical protein